jgi:uncharacterized membrane protein
MTHQNSVDLEAAALHWLGEPLSNLDESERQVLAKICARHPIARNTNESFEENMTFGQRLADKVAVFGGSWTFIIIFGLVLVAWTGVNLALRHKAFDAYPFIFLNLVLSMLAAIQAPIIMMSQNRQTAKDRADAAHDYEVNLKAELEIMGLHEKLDRIRTEQMEALLVEQQKQLNLLTKLAKSRN